MGLLPNPFRALIIGSSGTIGSAFVDLLKNNPSCSEVLGIHRQIELKAMKSCLAADSKMST